MMSLPAVGALTGGPVTVSVQGLVSNPLAPDALPGSPEAGLDREPVHVQVVVPATVSSLHNLALGWPAPRWALEPPVEDDASDHHGTSRRDKDTAAPEDEPDELTPPLPEADGAERTDVAHGGVLPGPCSYRTITRWLHGGRQWAALRELAMQRRVLVLQPLAMGDPRQAPPFLPLRAYLLWVDVCGVGQVRTLAARWWPGTDCTPPGRSGAWLSWRCHREQSDQGVRLVPSRTHLPEVPLIVLSDECQAPVRRAPGRSLLDLTDARRLFSWLGTQWSLQMVLMPTRLSAGKESR